MSETLPPYIRDLPLAREADRQARLQRERDAFIQQQPSRFERVYCSACGQGFGPGDAGFSHCPDHAHLQPDEDA